MKPETQAVITRARRGYVAGHLVGGAWDWKRCGQPCHPILDRLFMCHMPTCIHYSDRCKQEAGDYRTLAHLFYASGELHIVADCPPELRSFIEADAAQYHIGDTIHVSTSQTIVFGYEKVTR